MTIMKTMFGWVLSTVAPHMRKPNGGLGGWIAMRLMDQANPPSTIEGIRRMNLGVTDTFVELGAGHGVGLKAVLTNQEVVPKKIVCVEISADFRTKLEGIVQKETRQKLVDRVSIHSDDCRDMSFLADGSVDKMFAMNVIYFLDPIDAYLKEIYRVISPNGFIVFGCKFPTLPKDSDVFINIEESAIVEAMRAAGFEVTSKYIQLAKEGENKMVNYTELRGTKSA
mmetsp:Transcript_7940/g.12421  ORF Transcript_7940/g.12421 Transcript_7940/m.12421 type:complete len:225 (+) Transcript_7940:110-784(+)